MKILVAEDMAVSRLIVGMALKKLGHDVTAKPDGEQAWQAIQQDEYPLLITDCQMPYVDGLELCRRVRARVQPTYTYILMLTSLESKLDYMAAIKAGADDFLIKPFDEDILAARLCVAERIGGMLSERQQLLVLLPICPTCKKIRDERDKWTKVEEYVATHLHASVTASRCPQCEANVREGEQKLRSQMGTLRHTLRKTP